MHPKYKNIPHYTSNIYQIMQKNVYVAPEMEMIEVESEDSILLYDSPTGEGYNVQGNYDDIWS